MVRLSAAGAGACGVVLVMGVAWRAVLFGGDVGLSVQTGLLPFLPKAAVELALAVSVVTMFRSRGRTRTGQ